LQPPHVKQRSPNAYQWYRLNSIISKEVTIRFFVIIDFKAALSVKMVNGVQRHIWNLNLSELLEAYNSTYLRKLGEKYLVDNYSVLAFKN
jgi:hypothetical protein